MNRNINNGKGNGLHDGKLGEVISIIIIIIVTVVININDVWLVNHHRIVSLYIN